MSANKMLIDATHPEEMRVVVLKQGRVEEFDYESAARRQLRGNIYLAKVTRVEPSLQAAFVDYGGNRHGFLAFSEIHPDYYQIPMADRQALLEQEAMAEAERAAEDEAEVEDDSENDGEHHDGDSDTGSDAFSDDAEDGEDDTVDDVIEDNQSDDDLDSDDDQADENDDPALNDSDADSDAESDSEGEEAGRVMPLAAAGMDESIVTAAIDLHETGPDATDTDNDDLPHDVASADAAGDSVDADSVDEVVAHDALEEVHTRPRRRPRSYKIQEVIKRRQVILIQVVKEERGNKGAALTTYLSLAGRYTVLMPNTARGGGISRKITNAQDRKRLKSIATDLDVPEGMGLIVRTAGASRTKQELRRDFEYLLRLWESVRDLTLQSSAPCLVYEEGNLIKRSIRDLYNKDIDEVLVAGNDAYKQARDFMKMLMPSHAKNVNQHQDSESLFTIYGIERQLNAMFSPQVTLRSGGYIIIDQTEALVAIDVNSGKATREFSIEETALATNLEAATEIARQLRLRDLAGLVVIDFIDMDERRNNRAVERRLKEALRHDRARIQFGRISHFGLMEMSRQRLRTGVLEGSTSQCPHCQGTGIIRSTESVALSVLRAIEDAAVNSNGASIVAQTAPHAAIYILNHKRSFLNEIERQHSITVCVEANDKLEGANFTVGKVTNGIATGNHQDRTVVNMDWGFEPEPEQDEGNSRSRRNRRGRGRNAGDEGGSDHDDNRPRRRRRRRRGRGDAVSDRGTDETNVVDIDDEGYGDDDVPGSGPQPDFQDSSAPQKNSRQTRDSESDELGSDERQGRRSRRRRGRRGGNRDRRPRQENQGADRQDRDEHSQGGSAAEKSGAEARGEAIGDGTRQPMAIAVDAPSADSSPENQSSASSDTVKHETVAEPVKSEVNTDATVTVDQPTESQPKRRAPTSSAPKLERVLVTPEDKPVAPADATSSEQTEEQPARRGWWNRRLGRG